MRVKRLRRKIDRIKRNKPLMICLKVLKKSLTITATERMRDR